MGIESKQRAKVNVIGIADTDLRLRTGFMQSPSDQLDDHIRMKCYDLMRKQYGDLYTEVKAFPNKITRVIYKPDDAGNIVSVALLDRRRIYAASSVDKTSFQDLITEIANNGVFFGTISVDAPKLFAIARDMGMEAVSNIKVAKEITALYGMNIKGFIMDEDHRVVLEGFDGYRQYMVISPTKRVS